MMLRLLASAFVVFLAIAVPSLAAAQGERDPFSHLDFGGDALVAAILDGDTLTLDDGRQVRLVGIQAPKLPLGRPGFEAWPLAEESKAALSSLVADRRIVLGYGGLRTDRHGRKLAHLFTEDGVWVQGAMLEQGLARVYSFADNRALVTDMLRIEEDARRAARGIWALPYYRVASADAPDLTANRFEIVEGTVLEVAVVRGRAFLNFGPDWRTDFTATIGPNDLALFEAEGIAPQSYAGRHVRVRGWLKLRNGPMIEVTHPEQIEVLAR